MKIKVKLMILSIAAFALLAISIICDFALPEALNYLIPGAVLLGSHLYCLKKLPEQEE